MSEAVEIIAHRGYSAKAPENTLAALKAALAAGADAVEFDLHTAACGTPVLFHDTMLSRTTNGVGPLRRRTAAQLKVLDAGKWFSPDFTGEQVPTFAEALASLRDAPPRIYAEVKGFRELEDLDRMVRLAREADMLGRVIFISLNWTLLDRMRGQEAGLSVGYVVDEEGKVDEAVQRAAGDAASLVDFRADLLLSEPARARQCLDHGIDMAVWTVDEAVDASRLLELGVRRFTTNQVETLLAWKASL